MAKKSGKNLNFFFIVVVIIVVLVGVYYYIGPKIIQSTIPPLLSTAFDISPVPSASPTPDPTADWKVYVNSINNYSLKYPSTIWGDIVYVVEQGGNVSISNFKGRSIPIIQTRRTISVTVLPIATNQTVSSYLTTLVSQKRNAKTIKRAPITIGKLTGEEVTGLNRTLPTQNDQLNVFVAKGTKLFQITLNPYTLNSIQNSAWAQTFFQMLPTFRAW